MILRPNEQRGKLAITMIWIVMACHILCVISNAFEYFMVKAVIDHRQYSTQEIEASDSRQQLIAIVTMIALLASGVVYIRWFRRAYYNLHANTEFLSYSEGWSAGAWFVPILNLFRPYKIMNELYRETAGLLIKNGTQPNPQFKFVGLWWAFWVAGNILGRISARYAVKAEGAEEFLTANLLDTISSVIFIPLSVLAVIVVRNYMTMERMLEDAREIAIEEQLLQPVAISK